MSDVMIAAHLSYRCHVDTRTATVKVTKEKSAEHHEAMIAAGSRLFRERGFEGVGVVEIMSLAGLTHGAFYGHFASKDALCAEACKRAFDERLEAWGDDISLSEYIDRYVSAAHRDKAGAGCPIVSLAPQIGHRDKSVQKQFAKGVSHFIGLIAKRLPAEKFKTGQGRNTAAAILSAMVGSVALARSTASDRQLSAEILSGSRAAIAAKFGV